VSAAPDETVRGGSNEQIERSAALIERLLGDPELRRRFRADAAGVLREHGLVELAGDLGAGRQALLTLEMRESRSSLAGAMVAAAAEGVDVARLAEHAAPRLEHDAGRAVERLIKSLGHHARHHALRHRAPTLGARAEIPPLAAEPQAPAPQAPASIPQERPAAPPAPTATPAPTAAPAPAPGPAPERLPAPPAHVPTDHHLEGHSVAEPALPPDPLRYPGNAASPRQIATWMGAHALRAGIPPELPVMAALTESSLHNLDYGDRDSVGYFQMRLGLWDQGPYAGYLQHPERQIKWFIDQALAARSADPALAQNPDGWGEWIANVEQPDARYRYRYQLQLDAARELLRGADLTPPPPPVRETVGKAALDVALHYMGTPYQWGGSSPQSGFDCSGLVQYAYAQEGITLPRVAVDQFHVGIPVARDDLQPGDAVFFADTSGYVHHVGLYVGDGRFVNAPQTGEDVKISSLSDPYFAAQYAGARRYVTGSLRDPNNYARTMPTVQR
jgi:NlpC/P60 family